MWTVATIRVIGAALPILAPSGIHFLGTLPADRVHLSLHLLHAQARDGCGFRPRFTQSRFHLSILIPLDHKLIGLNPNIEIHLGNMTSVYGAVRHVKMPTRSDGEGNKILAFFILYLGADNRDIDHVTVISGKPAD
jgi:hypothetical protein